MTRVRALRFLVFCVGFLLLFSAPPRETVAATPWAIATKQAAPVVPASPSEPSAGAVQPTADGKTGGVGPRIRPLVLKRVVPVAKGAVKPATVPRTAASDFTIAVYATPFLQGKGIPDVRVDVPSAASAPSVLISLLQVHPTSGRLRMVAEGFCDITGQKVTCDPDFSFARFPKNAAYVLRSTVAGVPHYQAVIFGPRLKQENLFSLSPSTTAATAAWLYRVRFHTQQKTLPKGRRTVADYERVYADLLRTYRALTVAFQKRLPAGTALDPDTANELHHITAGVLLAKDLKKATARARAAFDDLAAPYTNATHNEKAP